MAKNQGDSKPPKPEPQPTKPKPPTGNPGTRDEKMEDLSTTKRVK